jgi:hypothetical protein
LVFFDDILVYNKTWKEHLRHLDEVFNIMEEQSLYDKEAKCEFSMTKILYLGHIISPQGVQVHREKIRPTPKNVTELRSFFGLCNYYRQFFRGFSHLGAPLTDLTRQGAFIWTDESHTTFDHMKEVMGTCPSITRLHCTICIIV